MRRLSGWCASNLSSNDLSVAPNCPSQQGLPAVITLDNASRSRRWPSNSCPILEGHSLCRRYLGSAAGCAIDWRHCIFDVDEGLRTISVEPYVVGNDWQNSSH